MTRCWSFLAFLAICLFVGRSDGARILAVFPFQAKSHYNVYEPLLKRLAEKGHDVVVISHFPQRVKWPNLTDVDVSASLPSLIGGTSIADIYDFTIWRNIRFLMRVCGVEICEPVLGNSGVKEIVRSSERFDLLIVEIFATECFLGMAHAMRIPNVIGAITSVAVPWSNEIVGSPDNPSYVPNWFGYYTDQMDLRRRIENTYITLVSKLAYRFLSDRPSYEIAKRHLGEDLPDFDALRSRISLILTNGHPAVSVPRPLAPGMKEISGIHIPPSGPEPLGDNLRDYLDSHREHGVIYFSFGSQIDTSTMSEQVLAALYRAFQELPQQILWKCSEEKMPALPRNVKCIEWAPQLSVLCHPNVRLFISHGGLLGTQEAIYCGVPILGMPLFGDQYLNMAYFKEKGFALEVNFRTLSYESLSSSLKSLLTNESYAKMARKASQIFKDRPIPPLEEAVYWVEYVLRHGSDSLKTAASQLSWYQYLLFDIFFTIGILILLTGWITSKFV